VDEPPDAPDRRPRAAFGPDLRLSALTGAGALAAAGLAVPADPGGRLLFLIAALVLAAYTASDLLFRTRLAVDADGLRVRSPFARADLAWPDVEAVRSDERSRYGLRSVSLEIDAGEHLIVLTRRALGDAPDAVAAIVRSFDPRGR
jgi:hypothetical protein